VEGPVELGRHHTVAVHRRQTLPLRKTGTLGYYLFSLAFWKYNLRQVKPETADCDELFMICKDYSVNFHFHFSIVRLQNVFFFEDFFFIKKLMYKDKYSRYYDEHFFYYISIV